MYITEEQLKKYTCKLEKKFINDFLSEFQKEYMDEWFESKNFDMPQLYNSNDMLEFLYSYPEINDKSKEFFYFMCMKTFDDVPLDLSKKFKIKFALFNCGTEIYDSYACANSNLLIHCNDIKHSFGCIKCKFSHHLLYCTELRHKSYMAFNKPVTKQRFEQLIKLSPKELQKVPEFVPTIYFNINSRIEYIYKLQDGA